MERDMTKLVGASQNFVNVPKNHMKRKEKKKKIEDSWIRYL
jgi:hypothetical protein